jgi:hypothetical protein
MFTQNNWTHQEWEKWEKEVPIQLHFCYMMWERLKKNMCKKLKVPARTSAFYLIQFFFFFIILLLLQQTHPLLWVASSVFILIHLFTSRQGENNSHPDPDPYLSLDLFPDQDQSQDPYQDPNHDPDPKYGSRTWVKSLSGNGFELFSPCLTFEKMLIIIINKL